MRVGVFVGQRAGVAPYGVMLVAEVRGCSGASGNGDGTRCEGIELALAVGARVLPLRDGRLCEGGLRVE